MNSSTPNIVQEHAPNGWVCTSIGHIASVASGGTPSRDISSYWQGDIPWVTTRQIDFGVITGPEEFITVEGLSNSAARTFKRGSILLALIGQGATRGKVAILGIDAAINQNCLALCVREEVNSSFIYHNLAHRYEEIRGLSNSGGQSSLNAGLVKSIKVLLPTNDEQAAIGRIGDTWDRAISQLTDLIAAKIRFKQGLMQQLLTGKRRFKEFENRDLGSCELKDFLIPTARPIDRPTKAYKALGLRSHGKGTFFRFVEDPEQVQMDTLYQVKKDDLIVNITFAWEGAIAIVSKNDEEALVSHRFPTFAFDRSKALPEYLKQVVITPWFIFKMGLVSPGGAGRNRVLNKKDFLKIEIPMPEIDEQSIMPACWVKRTERLNYFRSSSRPSSSRRRV